MAVGDGWAIELQYAVLGAKMSSTLHYIETIDITGSEVAGQIADAWWLETGGLWQAITSVDADIECIYVRKLRPLGEDNPSTKILGAVQGSAAPEFPTRVRPSYW